MGVYYCNEEEIASVMDELAVEMNCEGDFYEETFISGAKEYVWRLREQGAFIYSEKADNKGKMCPECGGDKDECKKREIHKRDE